MTGRRRRVSRTVRGSPKDGELALARLKVAGHERRLPSGGTNARSLAAALELYQTTAEVVRSNRAKDRHDFALRDQGDGVDGASRRPKVWCHPVEPADLARRRASLRGYAGFGSGPDWIRRCATVFTRGLELARKRGLIDANPSKDAVQPKSVRTKPFAPVEAEVRSVLQSVSASDPEMANLATVLASTGMRTGEVLGLRWADVNLSACEVHIAAAITDGGPGVGIVRKATKRSDWRDVPLTVAASAALQSQVDRYRGLFGQAPPPEAYVFAAGPDGVDPLRPDGLSHRWARSRGTSTLTLLDLRLRGYRNARRWRVVPDGGRHPGQQRSDPTAPLRRPNRYREAQSDRRVGAMSSASRTPPAPQGV